ncbi:hypothetical protein SAMN06272771_0122 [Streptomyces sp. Ag82_O1-12]|uniref:hypothetical protein n=1 Tax=unclassified Streptomyces TaxID=2593676 RepID=UPI000BC44898|nr:MULTISPECIES: hypothetical protein [unclassified Streptomyces]SMQ13845.1 hypothetical protein SAMN06272771_0122 [Streptomyces sp. Ag82_O1-12]SOD42875.1 hypothetical protein SAMN06272727_0112 [Streptomyces sp. Ag82_G6-1]
MEQSEDQILVEELAALGAMSGGSGRLTGLVARLLKKNAHEIDLVVPLPFDDAVQRVAGVLEGAGRPGRCAHIESGRDQEMIRVVAGGGAGGMNPVVVTALVARGTGNRTEVKLRAAAKEGLVKQRAGEKTAARLAALLNQ